MLIAFSPARDATMKTYKQLTYKQRCQIYALSKTGMSQNKIAKQLKVSQSTISREFSRNTGKRGYRFKQAQASTDSRRLAACKAIKMTTALIALIALIESKLTVKWSPEQVSGWIREDQGIDISYETIYQHIVSDKKVVAIYSNIYVGKVKLINHAVSIKKQAQGLLRTVSVSISVRTLLMIKVEWVIGKLTWLLAKVTVAHWSRL
jgi:IS30 family transposase